VAYLVFEIYLFLLASLALFVGFRSVLCARRLWRGGALRRAGWFGSPLVVVLALVYLTGDFLLLPRVSAVGAWRETEVFMSRSYAGMGRRWAFVSVDRREGGGYCVDPHWTMARIWAGPPAAITAQMPAPSPEGFWGLTHTRRVYLPEYSPEPPVGDEPEIRSLVAEQLLVEGTEHFAGHAAGMLAGRAPEVGLLWGRIARSAAAGVVALVGAGSLVASPWWWRRTRRALDGSPRCVRCGYPKEGVVSGRCPECGLGYAGESLALG